MKTLNISRPLHIECYHASYQTLNIAAYNFNFNNVKIVFKLLKGLITGTWADIVFMQEQRKYKQLQFPSPQGWKHFSPTFEQEDLCYKASTI